MSEKNIFPSLTINNVDTDLLEEQRYWLHSIFRRNKELQHNQQFLLHPEENALLGILNMLDAWSDDIFFKTNGANAQEKRQEGIIDNGA